MNNQQNQSDTPTPGDSIRMQNVGSTTGSAGQSGTGASGAGGNAGGGRKMGAAGQGASASAGSQSGDQSAQTSGSSPKQDEGQAGNQILNTALESGKKWIEDSGVLNNVNQLPQSVKNWGSRAVTRVSDLTTTQKIVGGALLAVGIGYLATRKNSGKADKSQSRYGRQSGGNYGRSSGYQAPDASNSRRSSVGSGRTDSGSAYGNSTSGAGSYGGNAGNSNSGSGFGSSTSGSDLNSRTSESSYRPKNDDFRSVE